MELMVDFTMGQLRGRSHAAGGNSAVMCCDGKATEIGRSQVRARIFRSGWRGFCC